MQTPEIFFVLSFLLVVKLYELIYQFIIKRQLKVLWSRITCEIQRFERDSTNVQICFETSIQKQSSIEKPNFTYIHSTKMIASQIAQFDIEILQKYDRDSRVQFSGLRNFKALIVSLLFKGPDKIDRKRHTVVPTLETFNKKH